MAQRPTRFDQVPTNVMRDEQLLALVRQTNPNEPLLTPLVVEATADSAPTALYRAVDVRRIERERREAADAQPEEAAATVAPAEAAVATIAPAEAAVAPTLAQVMNKELLAARTVEAAGASRRTLSRKILLLLVAGGVAYLTWRAPVGLGRTALVPAPAPASATATAR